jgi:outer membrane protein OmpA-like peptidoglycan-associated protein
MSSQNDETQTYALGAVAGIVGLVIAGVIALAASTLMRSKPAPPAETMAAPVAAEPHTQTPAETPAAATSATAAPIERLYFEVGSPALPADAAEVLARVADAARASGGATVLISGFHDASGDAAQNAELAKNRALAVRHALEANGVPPERLQMSKPAVTTGEGDPKEARRVELRLQP